MNRHTFCYGVTLCGLVLFIVVAYDVLGGYRAMLQTMTVVQELATNISAKDNFQTVEYGSQNNENRVKGARTSTREIVKKTSPAVYPNQLKPVARQQGDVPCGAICSYGGTPVKTKFYPFIEKPVNCKNIFTRMKYPQGIQVYPPLRKPPAHMVDQLTQNGTCRLTNAYSIGFKPQIEQKQILFPRRGIDELMKRDQAGKRISSYNENGNIRRVLNMYKSVIAGKEGLVVGSQKPWIEAQLLNVKAKKITTLEYAPVVFQHPQLETKHPEKMAGEMLDGTGKQFEFGVSYSSLEHSGLGRYGDPVNPYGDLEAMAQNWCFLKPGAYFFLGLPVSKGDSCTIVWNMHRIYGSARLQHLTANWKVIGKYYNRGKDQQHFIVLQKPLQ